MKKRIVMVNAGPRRRVVRRRTSAPDSSGRITRIDRRPRLSDQIRDYLDPRTRTVIESNALKHMKNARMRLIGPFNKGGKPWMGASAMALTFIPRPGRGTLSVDSSWRLYYNPDEIIYWPVDALAAVIEHELWHLLRKHHRRADYFGITKRTSRQWNIAADTEIHSDEELLRVLLTIPFDDPRKEPMYPARFGQPRNKTTEWYYDAMFPEDEDEDYDEDYDEDEGEGEYPGPEGEDLGEGEVYIEGYGPVYTGDDLADPVTGNSGSAADGIQQPGELPPTDETVNHAEEERIIQITAEDIRNAAKQYGSEMGDSLIDWSNTQLAPPKVDWRDTLRNVIDDTIEYARGQLEHTYSRMSPRQPASPHFRLAGLHSPKPIVAVVLDVSGSMFSKSNSPRSQEDVEEGERFNTLLYDALTEIAGLLEQLGSTIGVNILVTDTAVHSAERVFDVEDLELVGGGGTNMGVGLKAAAELAPPPSVVICLTDGYTPWPKEYPDVDATYVVGIVGATEESLGEQWKLPEWVDEVVFIDEE